jgi:hypothetical protein
MTKSRKKTTAIEIARDGFGCFTGWAHQHLKPYDEMRVAKDWQRRGDTAAESVTTGLL